MNGEFDSKFEELFRNFSEEPSANCWDAISQKLDAVLPVDGSSAASQGTSSFSKIISSSIGKSVAIITGVAIVGVATFAILNSSETPKTSLDKTQNTQLTANKTEITENAPAESVTFYNNQNSTVNTDTKPTQTDNSEKNSSSVASEKTNVSQAISEPIVNTFVAPKESNPHTTTSENNPQLTEESNKETEETTIEVSSNPVVASPVMVEKVATSLNLVFPNIITPNGDGFNDFLVIKNIETISNSRLVIINANGIKVFEANNYQNNWDASNAPDGTYFYVFETKVDGKAQTIYGTMQILR